MTLNTTWGYSEHDHAWKSDETLIRNLIDIASKGGNYLLNIGPKGDGSVPAESVKSMQAIGAWMKVNGEAIYGTTASPFAKPRLGPLHAQGRDPLPARLRLAQGWHAGGPPAESGERCAAAGRPESRAGRLRVVRRSAYSASGESPRCHCDGRRIADHGRATGHRRLCLKNVRAMTDPRASKVVFVLDFGSLVSDSGDLVSAVSRCGYAVGMGLGVRLVFGRCVGE